MQGSAVSIISAVLLGLSLGYILQRGRFCLNSAFRDIIFLDNLTTFRAYLISVVVAIIGSNLIQDMGFMITPDPQTGEIIHTALLRQNFVPLANILGGFLCFQARRRSSRCHHSNNRFLFRGGHDLRWYIQPISPLPEGVWLRNWRDEKSCILAYLRPGPHD